MADEGSTGTRTIAGVERALDVLALFTQNGVRHLGVTEIAEELDLSKAVVHRILSSFRTKGYVEIDEETRRYHLGAAVLTLGLAYLEGLDVQGMARTAIRDLSAATNETATLSVRVGWERVYIDQANPDRDIKMVVQLGSGYPLHAGASSKAMLAFLPEEMSRAYLDSRPLDALTDITITEREALEEELKEIRDRGYAISYGERQEGAGSVAAPVLQHDGRVQYVMSVCGPVDRFSGEVESCADALLSTTEDVSHRLGFRD